MAKKLKSYKVSAVVKVWADATIEAESLEDAVTKSRDLRAKDFVNVVAIDHIDSSFRITGVQDSDWESIDG